ncbi:MAG TPA: CBS domain-containing protein [Gammaproteobacteria bacterium]|nr:CBS domain-containing protein [Gammaproteobacteria bacterium]
MRHFASENAGVTDLKVNELMSKDVVSVPPTTTVDEALSLMTENRFRRLPVVDDTGRLCGLLTMGDLVRASLKEKTDEAESLRSYIVS